MTREELRERLDKKSHSINSLLDIASAAIDHADALAREVAELDAVRAELAEARPKLADWKLLEGLVLPGEPVVSGVARMVRELAELHSKLAGIEHAITDTNVVIEQVSSENAALKRCRTIADEHLRGSALDAAYLAERARLILAVTLPEDRRDMACGFLRELAKEKP